ncbi:hypothetical protein LTR85_010168 [Meristemomyces frigidus]|nr:hypothetical protein LTR85_010168 [Meristemomyces frigidus]
MLSRTILLAAAVFAASALAQETAGVTIEASHGGAGSGLTNTTITIPLNTTYTNVALDEVSYLFLTSATGVPLESITCTPHLYANGTGAAGDPFTSSQFSALSTNTVQVGSITCVSTSGDTSSVSSSASSTGTAISVPTISNGTALLTTASLSASATSSTVEVVSTVSDATSTFLTTIPASSAATSQQSTVTSVMTASDGGSSPTSASATGDSASVQSASSTSSASASLSSDNAARRLALSELVWPGLAVGALGLAMAV